MEQYPWLQHFFQKCDGLMLGIRTEKDGNIGDVFFDKVEGQ